MGRFGTAAKGVIYGPDVNVWHAGFFKNFYLGSSDRSPHYVRKPRDSAARVSRRLLFHTASAWEARYATMTNYPSASHAVSPLKKQAFALPLSHSLRLA